MTEICIGIKAPEFTLPASNGPSISLMDFRDNKYVVLCFYPEDLTSGCTQEALAFRDLQSAFQLAGAGVLPRLRFSRTAAIRSNRCTSA